MKIQKERIIHLDDMLLYIARQWKVFVLGVIVVGVIFGGIGYFKVNKKYSLMNENKNNEVTTNKMAIDVSDKELANIETILFWEKAVKEQKEYNENSILMNINPYEKKIASIRYSFRVSGAIESEEIRTEYLERGRKAYQNVFDKNDIYEYVKKAILWGNDEKYLKELVWVELDSENILCVNIIGTDEEIAQGIQDSVKRYLLENNNQILKNCKEVSVKVDSEYINTVVDTGLQGTQTAQYNNLRNLQAQINSCDSELSDNARLYLELARPVYEEGNYEPGQTLYKEIKSIPDKKVAVSLSHKIYESALYAFKRIILVVFLIICVFALKYMWSSRLMYVYDLRDMYSIKVIDVLSEGGIDCLSITAEKVTSNMENMENGLLILSSDKRQMDSGIVKNLIQELEEKINVKLASEIEDIATIRLLKECNSIILVESIGKSRYSRIQDTIENIKILNRSVKGAIIVKNY